MLIFLFILRIKYFIISLDNILIIEVIFLKKLLLFVTVLVMFYIPNVSAMEISVKTLDGSNLKLEVESSDVIEAVKMKIYNADNKFLPENQRLLFKGQEMEDGRTLADYSVEQDSTIHLLLKLNKKYEVVFDANGGKFNGGDSYSITWDDDSYDNLVEPSRGGYYFSGYYTEKEGGTKLELILAESGIDQDMTFYAHWEKAIDNPKTSSNSGIITLMVILLIEGAFIVSTLFSKKM